MYYYFLPLSDPPTNISNNPLVIKVHRKFKAPHRHPISVVEPAHEDGTLTKPKNLHVLPKMANSLILCPLRVCSLHVVVAGAEARPQHHVGARIMGRWLCSFIQNGLSYNGFSEVRWGRLVRHYLVTRDHF